MTIERIEIYEGMEKIDEEYPLSFKIGQIKVGFGIKYIPTKKITSLNIGRLELSLAFIKQ